MIKIRDSYQYRLSQQNDAKESSPIDNSKSGSKNSKSSSKSSKVQKVTGPLQSKCLNKDDYKNGVTASTGGKLNVGWVF